VELARLARTEYRWGATRTRIWLDRVHQIRVNAKTLQRVFCDLGLPVLMKTPKRKPKQLKLFEKDAPGDSIQVDVKVVPVKRERAFQYTALNDCTRLRVLRLYARQNQHSSITSWTSSAAPDRFRSRSCSATTGRNFRSPSS